MTFLDFRYYIKARLRDQIGNIHWIIEAREVKKKSTSAVLTTLSL